MPATSPLEACWGHASLPLLHADMLDVLWWTHFSLGSELPLTLMMGMGSDVRDRRRRDGNQILSASARLRLCWHSQRPSSGSVTAML